MSLFISRGWDETSARRVVGLAYEAEPSAPILDEAFMFHDVGPPTRYGNMGFIDGGAGKERMSKQQSADFWERIVGRYPKQK